MINTISNRIWLLSFLGLSMIIVGIEFFLVHSPKFTSDQNLFSLAVTLDLTIFIPLLYYFTISRKLNIHPVTVLIVFFICTIIATIILPSQNHSYLDKIKYLLIFTEVGISTYLVIRISKIIRAFKFNSLNQIDFLYNLTIAIQQVLGNSKLWDVVIGEINTIRYGLLFWLGKKEVKEGQKFYTTHKKSGYSAIWSIIFFVMVIETTGLHFLISRWSVGIAIVVTILSVYTIIFLISDLAAIIKRPIIFSDKKLFFRIGIRWNTIIDPANIESIEQIRNFDKKKDKDILNCALAGDPNMKIELKDKITFKSFYGIKKTSDKFVFNIDNEKEFIEEIRNYFS